MLETESRRDPDQSPRDRRVPWLVLLLGLVVLSPSIWRETSITGSDEYVLSLRTPMEMSHSANPLRMLAARLRFGLLS